MQKNHFEVNGKAGDSLIIPRRRWWGEANSLTNQYQIAILEGWPGELSMTERNSALGEIVGGEF
jgi:hypothetical protein